MGALGPFVHMSPCIPPTSHPAPSTCQTLAKPHPSRRGSYWFNRAPGSGVYVYIGRTWTMDAFPPPLKSIRIAATRKCRDKYYALGCEFTEKIRQHYLRQDRPHHLLVREWLRMHGALGEKNYSKHWSTRLVIERGVADDYFPFAAYEMGYDTLQARASQSTRSRRDLGDINRAAMSRRRSKSRRTIPVRSSPRRPPPSSRARHALRPRRRWRTNYEDAHQTSSACQPPAARGSLTACAHVARRRSQACQCCMRTG